MGVRHEGVCTLGHRSAATCDCGDFCGDDMRNDCRVHADMAMGAWHGGGETMSREGAAESLVDTWYRDHDDVTAKAQFGSAGYSCGRRRRAE